MFVRPCLRPPRWRPAPRPARHRLNPGRCRPTSGAPVAAPHYGDALFHFFQDHYFTSITTRMARAAFPAHRPHDDEAEVLRGGMLLLLPRPAQGGRRDLRAPDRQGRRPGGARPRLVLPRQDPLPARLPRRGRRRRRAHRSADLPKSLEGRPAAAAVQPDDGARRLPGAAALLEGVDKQSPLGQYARSNLGVAQAEERRGGQRRQAARTDRPRRQPRLEEMRALRDKTNLRSASPRCRPPCRTNALPLQRACRAWLRKSPPALVPWISNSRSATPATPPCWKRASRSLRLRRAGRRRGHRATTRPSRHLRGRGRLARGESIAAIRSGTLDRRP